MRVSLPKMLLGMALLAVLVLSPASAPEKGHEADLESNIEKVTTHDFLTPTALVEKIYPSMMGPEYTDLDVHLAQGHTELLWVTGYSARMVGPDGEEPRSQELMCHNTLSFHQEVEMRRSVLGSGFNRSRRLFTLSQGQDRLEFPPGYGIPASSSEAFMLQSQVLNLRQDRIGQEVRHLVSTDYLPDKEVDRPMQALTLIDFGIGLEVVDPQARELPDNPLGCAVDAGGQPTHVRGDKEMTAHWVVKPGPETRKTYLGKAFPFDTTIHYIAVHLHSYAESLELRDLTTGESVYLARTQATPDGKGLKNIEYYSSTQGIPVFAAHRYELVSRYNNTSNEDQTAMAFMFCYVKDPYFEKPDPGALAQRFEEFCGVRGK